MVQRDDQHGVPPTFVVLNVRILCDHSSTATPSSFLTLEALLTSIATNRCYVLVLQQYMERRASWPSYTGSGREDRYVLFRIASPSDTWIAIKHNHIPRIKGAALDLLSKLDKIRMKVIDNPMQIFLEIDNTARFLCTSRIGTAWASLF